jgi:hypothetical protein
LVHSTCDVFLTACPATGFYGFRDSALRATCPVVLLTLNTISLRWSCVALAECYHVRIMFLQQNPHGTFVQLCVKTELHYVLYVRTPEGQMDLTGPTLHCYVPGVFVSSQLNMFFFLELRKLAVHTEIHLWPTRISSTWRYARCPPPVATPCSTYTYKVLTDANLFPVMCLRAAGQLRRVPVKVTVGYRLTHGTLRRRLGRITNKNVYESCHICLPVKLWDSLQSCGVSVFRAVCVDGRSTKCQVLLQVSVTVVMCRCTVENISSGSAVTTDRQTDMWRGW